MEITDETTLGVVFFAMQVGFLASCFAMGAYVVVMLQQMVEFLTGHRQAEHR